MNRKPPRQLKIYLGLAIAVALAGIGIFLIVRSRATTLRGVIQPTAGGLNVRDAQYGARGDGTGDDTSAFTAAITAAGSGGPKFNNGPTGQAQGVVYVPAGTYPLHELSFKSSVRMEVDAGAVLEMAGGRGIADGSTLIRWDGPVGAPLQNVSLIGVGSSSGGLKTKASPVASGRSLEPDMTLNLDPVDSNTNNKISGLIILNAQGFLVENVYSIQNDDLQSAQPNDPNWYPTSQKAALVTRARADSPCTGPFAMPYDGTVSNWYNIHGPKGYGPNQIGAGQNISFDHIFAQGGTALRLETDSSEPTMNDISGGKVCPDGKTKFGAEIRRLAADDIEGLNCNRTVAFTPHLQDNYDVRVSNVKSTNCAEAVAISRSPVNDSEGSFTDSTVASITVAGGNGAQLGTQGQGVGYWTVGESLMAFSKSDGTPWDVIYSGRIDCSGNFQKVSDLITPPGSYNSGLPFSPLCPGVTDITPAGSPLPTPSPTPLPASPTPIISPTALPSTTPTTG